MSWKFCAKSSSLNKVKPISCFGLGKGCKAGNLTVFYRIVPKTNGECSKKLQVLLMKLTPPLQE